MRAALRRVDTPAGGDDILPAPDAFPGYEIIREIHRGGQGIVYQAIQKATKRKVALKVLHGGPYTGSKGRARFEREVAILAQLDHPNIVGILDSGTSVGQAFYVMDYVSGQTLEAWMAGDPKPIGDILPLFSKICEAVNAAHLKGITHRDLKPSNIRIDHSGEPHILDFGLAKVVIGEVTEETQPRMMSMTGQFIGSLPWASPEQAEGAPDKVDLRTDVYSLGVILYQLLTGGKFPYEVIGNMRDVMENILRAEPARPSTIRRQINDEVETIVLKALQKERDRRYQTAGELGRDVRRYLSGEPIEAMRDSGWYVIRKTLRRYKAQTVVAGAFLLLLVGSAITSYALYRQSEQRRVVAEKALEARDAALGVATSEKQRAEAIGASFKKVTDAGRSLRRVAFTDYARRIENLVGATGARKTLLDGAREYVAALQGELSSDPEYLEELAEAHEAVARLQSGLYLPRVGETPAGVANLQAALDIREQLLSGQPTNTAMNVAFSRSLLQLATAERVAQRFDAAVEHAARARGVADKAMTLAPAGSPEQRPAEDARASALLTMGELSVRRAFELRGRDINSAQGLILEAEARFDEVGALFSRRLAADASDKQAQRLVVTCRDKKTQAWQTLGDLLTEDAKSLAEKRDPEAERRLGDALLAYEDATASGRQCQAEYAALYAAGPSAVLRRDMCVNNRNIGMALTSAAAAIREYAERAGGWERYWEQTGAMLRDAEGPLRESVAIARELAGADRSNVEAQRGVYVCLNSLADCLIEAGVLRRAVAGAPDAPEGLREEAAAALTEAEVAARESLVLREKLVGTDRTQLHRRDLGMGYDKVGHALMERGAFAEAAEMFAKALAELDSLAAEKAFDVGSQDYLEIAGRHKGTEARRHKGGGR